MVTFRPPDGGGWQMPYEDAYVLFVAPELVKGRLRLEVRPSFTKESSQLYYGIGNASAAPETGPMGQGARSYFQYGRLHPTLSVRTRIRLKSPVWLLVGNKLTYNELDVHAGRQLDRDRQSQDEKLRSFFGPLGPHFVDLFELGLEYDTRDDETSSDRGFFHQLNVRLNPGGSGAFPYRYAQIETSFCYYATPARNRLHVQVRGVGDWQIGHPPFYELARYEDTFAIGGVNGVRGVPAQRYYGKIKTFANVETRYDALSFRLGKERMMVAVAAFFDAGRLWSDIPADPVRDGTVLGLKWGVGGGARVQQGHAFVVRADVAWSPDARPIGACFTAGQIF